MLISNQKNLFIASDLIKKRKNQVTVGSFKKFTLDKYELFFPALNSASLSHFAA